MTRISVCIATYNGEKFIKEQIDSIILQLSDIDEIIISDDHSDDSTIEIIRSYNDPRIKIFYNKKQRGFTNNFANALSEAKGEYIFLADQDDVWLENKVSITLEKLGKYDFVISDADTVDASLNVINSSRFEEYNIKNGFVRNLIKTRYLGCCMAFNRRVLKSLFPFPENVEYCPHDLWITLISEYYFKCEVIDKPLILYRRHQTNVSCGGFSKGRPFHKKLMGRLYCLKAVLSQKRYIERNTSKNT
ncbi:glycosyltransferase [Proteiniclasticum sp. C24MP]|uniref:glycosyltransferase n=1 Tax=Proteiniclasticum sp. C24MP TaxID=3374101 RepID=UPI003754845E